MAEFAAMLETLRSPGDELAPPPVSRAVSARGRAAARASDDSTGEGSAAEVTAAEGSAGEGSAGEGVALDVGVIARWLLLGCVVGLVVLAFADGLRAWW
jgi:hypothetical protein